MINQYAQRYQELQQQFCAGVSKANEYRRGGNVAGFIAQVRDNQDIKAQRDAVWALMGGE